MSKESGIRTQGSKSQHQAAAFKQVDLGLVTKRNKPIKRANNKLAVEVLLRPTWFSWSAVGYMP